MKILFTFAIAVAALLATATNVFAALVETIPGLPGGSLPGGSQLYSGYYPLDSNGAATFYMYATAETGPGADPGAANRTILWLTGGPGCSGISALFTENGPIKMDYSGNGTTVKYNPWTWSRLGNVLWIESPRSVGFSRPDWNWSTPTNIGDDQTSLDTISVLLQFFDEFPQQRQTEFYITAESYGGHYGTSLLQHIQAYNAGVPPSKKINVTGLTFGNAWISPPDEAFGVTDMWWYRNIISENVYNDINRYCTYREITSWIINNVTLGGQSRGGGGFHRRDWEATKDSLYRSGVLRQTESSELCFAALYKGSIVQFGQIDILGFEDDVCNNVAEVKPTTYNGWTVNWCNSFQLTTYLNLPEVQKAYHVVDPAPWGWTGCTNSGVLNYNQADTQKSYLPVMQSAVASGRYKILVYSGTSDSIVPFPATRRWIRKMVESLKLPVVNDFHEWFANTNGRQVAGWSTQYANGFTFTTLRGASHLAPMTQAHRAYEMLKNFFTNGSM